jgi:hypothetical protein
MSQEEYARMMLEGGRAPERGEAAEEEGYGTD